MDIKKIVLTGGPCSGKTTAKNYLMEKLSDYGFFVIFVPEVPTLIINSGLDPRQMKTDGRSQYFSFQELMLKTQLKFEDEIFQTAAQIKGGEKPVMILDRGAMDYRAYTSPEEFQKLLADNNWNLVDLRDSRYDAVFHLVTAAEGAEKFYNLDNPARLEADPAVARNADLRTREAWLGHPHLKVIDNSTPFEEKLKRLLKGVQRALGIPASLETERKFLLLEKLDTDRLPVPAQKIIIEQFYAGDNFRYRRRTQNNNSIYYQTRKMNTDSPLTRIEIEEKIPEKKYFEALQSRNPKIDLIKKERSCFLYKNQYFELDRFLEPERIRGLLLLEIELTEENDRVEIPDWLGRVREVTGNPQYENFFLAKGGQI